MPSSYLRGPGHWGSRWAVGLRAYRVTYAGEPVGLLKRRHAPRCYRCRAYSVGAGEQTDWKWACKRHWLVAGHRAPYAPAGAADEPLGCLGAIIAAILRALAP